MARRSILAAMGALKWSDYAVVAAGLFLVGWLGQPDELPVQTDEARSVIVHHGDRKMRDGAREAFDERFARGGHFGAFYLSSDGSFGWAAEQNTPNAARLNAETHCLQTGANCRLVAEMVPAGFEDRGGVTLRANAAAAYRAYLDGQGARAIAVSENGTWGWSQGHVLIWSATSAALRECESRRRDGQADYLPDWPCTVIAARWR